MTDSYYPSKAFEHAVHEIAKLPGIGKKTAMRLVLHMLKQETDYTQSLGLAISNIHSDINFCSECNTIADTDICVICANPLRDNTLICVVESVKDVMAIENTGEYRGVYHVLGGVISPMEGVGAEDLSIHRIVERVESNDVAEIIFALPATIEGETTSFYIYKKIKHTGIKVSALSRGVAVGDELEYADEATLARSIKDRVVYSY